MKKTGILMSVIIIVLALVVGIVGITAAWFADNNDETTIITVTSQEPSGTATIVVTSSNPDGDFPTNEKLCPAILKKGLSNADRTGTNEYSTIDVPYAVPTGEGGYGTVQNGNVYDSTGNDDSKPFSDYAKAVSTSLQVKFSGMQATKNLRFELTSATLSNPRSENAKGEIVADRTLPDYKDEFTIIMTTITCNEDNENRPATNIEQIGSLVNFTVYSGYTYTIDIVVYFKYADEFTSPELIDTRVFFNFELITLANV